MRVIAGQCKGRILFGPKDQSIRPTSDRIKEYIFDRIGPRVASVQVLDLFAGTGNLSIEALSRGAHSATLVDISQAAIKLIYKNLKLTQLFNDCQVVHTNVFRFLDFAEKTQKKFGLIFADPPYSEMVYHKIIQRIDSNTVLEKGGLFIFEQNSKVEIELDLKKLAIESRKKMGDTAVTFYLKKEA